VTITQQPAATLADDANAQAPTPAEPCPNGQPRSECTEIDPCESCWQDQQDEGDAIEITMGLRGLRQQGIGAR
jgi:hypothetical protein